MSDFLRVIGFEAIPAPGLDGHRYQLAYELGEIVNGTFVPREEYKVPVTTSRTLQAVWKQNDAQMADTSASAAVVHVTNVASSGNLSGLTQIGLNTYTAPKDPPQLPRVEPGAIFPVPRKQMSPQFPSRYSFLSDDIAEIRDQVNALSSHMTGERLLELPQERAILDVYKPGNTPEEFRNRIQSLATICTSLNKQMLGKALSKDSTVKIGSITLLRDYLNSLDSSGAGDAICDVFKNINNLRKGYPAHGDNTAEYIPAHDFFDLKYPVTEFAVAWDTVLGCYFQALGELRDLLSRARTRTKV